MKRKAYQVVFPATLVVMVAFLTTIFFASTNFSFAASVKKKSPAVARTSAVDYTEAQIKQLQNSLNITEAQKELWNNLIQVMRENAKDMDALTMERVAERAERAENDTTMNAVGHMKLHSRITQAHLDQMKKLIPPFEAFYESLSDEQKQITDEIFQTGRHERKHKRHMKK